MASLPFWSFDTNHWFNALLSSEKGITDIQANKILTTTSFTVKKKSPFWIEFGALMEQFKSPLMLLLIGAVILSAFLGDTSDVFIILFIVVSTGLLSYFQERNARKVVAKLQSLIAPYSRVIRDGKEKTILCDTLVPGDIVLLKAGDIIPADCLLIQSNQLYTNESSLTGESFPIPKTVSVLPENTALNKRENSVWQGTNVLSGTAKALVIYTGKNTQFGSIIEGSSVVYETNFEKGIKHFGFFLMKITLFLSVFILVVNLINHKTWMDSVLFALALAVGMAPELLPAITTIAMSAGAKRLLAQKVIVKKLSSIQNLGEVNLLCTDKTGTITEGALVIDGIVDIDGKQSDFAKQLAIWNAQLESAYSNPIDEAIKKLDNKATPTLPQKLGELPYDFTRKRLSIAAKVSETELYFITKGAAASVLDICTRVRLSEQRIEDIATYKKNINESFEKYGKEGARVIAVAYKNLPTNYFLEKEELDMIFAGFILIKDPVKNGIKATIEALQELSVEMKIITGDNQFVALSIANQLGIAEPTILTGTELFTLSEEELKAKATRTHIFAEVEPQQKERIIKLLRSNYVVAYMGDGINDVTALNAADVGISVENAVDIAKSEADFVLIEKDLSVLVQGIKEGRKTFANTLKYIFINTGSTFGNMFSVAAASLLLPFLPMLPKQILLTNFITDFPYLSVASDNVDEEQVARPGKWDLKLIRRYMVIFGLHSSVFDIVTFGMLYFVLKVGEATFQTSWFIESILTELFILFIIRTHKQFFKSKPGKYLTLLSILGLVLTITLPYLPLAKDFGLIPIPFKLFATMLAIVLGYIVTADLLKIWFFKKYYRENQS